VRRTNAFSLPFKVLRPERSDTWGLLVMNTYIGYLTGKIQPERIIGKIDQVQGQCATI